jgi:hypothetical protein
VVARPESVATVGWAVSWLVGLGAIILLCRRPSSAFFASRGRWPAPPEYLVMHGIPVPAAGNSTVGSCPR